MMVQRVGNTSEIASLREQLTNEYRAAKWGLSGFACGVSRHQFITARSERMGMSYEALAALVGPDQAIQIVAETLQDQPEQATRSHLVDVLLHELGETEATRQLLDDIKKLWAARDMLTERFGAETTRKIIDAPVSLPIREEIRS